MSATEITKTAEFNAAQAWAPVGDGSATATEVYAELRNRCPVARAPGDEKHDIWYSFAAADVARILTNPETFASSSEVKRFGMALIPIETDPPEHTGYKALFKDMLAPRRLMKFEQTVRDHVGRELDRLIPLGTFDIAPLTEAVPLQIFSQLLGEENLTFHEIDARRREERGASELGKLDGEAAERRRNSLEPLLNFCRERLAAVRENPGENLATDIAFGKIDGRPLSDQEILSIYIMVYIAGHRTTTGGLQAAILQLGQHPEAQDELRANTRKIPAAIEEALRLETPFHALPRHCTADTTVGGQAIRKGDQMFPCYGAANLDPAAFPDPGKFDIDRKPAHFAFGRGIHMCAGAPLARMEIRVLVEELLKRTQRFELAGQPERLEWPDNGCSRLEITVS